MILLVKVKLFQPEIPMVFLIDVCRLAVGFLSATRDAVKGKHE